MKEFRLTFAADDFAMVSQALVAMGVSFHVEPVASAPNTAEVDEDHATAVAKVRSPAKATRKAPVAHRTQRSKPETRVPPTNASMGGADRLREAIARSGSAYRSVMEPAKAADASEAADNATQPGLPVSE